MLFVEIGSSLRGRGPFVSAKASVVLGISFRITSLPPAKTGKADNGKCKPSRV